MDYTGLLELIDDDFDEIEDGVCKDLGKACERYRAMVHESSEIDVRHPFIWQTLYGQGEISLTAEEHEVLVNYLQLEHEIQNMERKAIYCLRTCKDTCTQGK